MSPLVELAKDILQQAERLEKQLQDIDAPQPSLEEDGPWRYPSSVEHPEVWVIRESIATMSKRLLQLSLGPADMIRYMVGKRFCSNQLVEVISSFFLGPERCNLPLLKVMDHFNVSQLVPRNGSISFEELANDMKVHPEIVKRVFRMAFGINLFKEEPKGHVAHTSLSTTLPMLSGWMKFTYRRDITDAMLSWPDAMLQYDEPTKLGTIPFNIGNGHDKTFFEVMQEEDDMAMFTDAMKSSEAGRDAGHFLYGFDWASLGEGPVVDLGGGNGHIAIPIAEKYPELKIIIQDLEVNRQYAAELIPAELRNRITFQVQDFFQPQIVKTGAKVFFLRHIIHDWPDEDACRILKQLVPEVENGARILVSDRVPGFTGSRPTYFDSLVHWLDLLMWTILGAKERSAEQWQQLLEKTDKRLKILSLKIPAGTEFAMIEIGF
jgi:6-hydroxytryprostatin B O-methyltransferase